MSVKQFFCAYLLHPTQFIGFFVVQFFHSAVLSQCLHFFNHGAVFVTHFMAYLEAYLTAQFNDMTIIGGSAEEAQFNGMTIIIS